LRKVRAVQARDEDGGYTYVRRVTFLDSEGIEIDSYNPENKERLGVMHEIEANEELIGVYGIKDKRWCFTGFGFIVKVREW